MPPICPRCPIVDGKGIEMRPYAKTASGTQRYRCPTCGKTASDSDRGQGRPPVGDRPMTSTERSRKCREAKRGGGEAEGDRAGEGWQLEAESQPMSQTKSGAKKAMATSTSTNTVNISLCLTYGFNGSISNGAGYINVSNSSTGLLTDVGIWKSSEEIGNWLNEACRQLYEVEASKPLRDGENPELRAEWLKRCGVLNFTYSVFR